MTIEGDVATAIDTRIRVAPYSIPAAAKVLPGPPRGPDADSSITGATPVKVAFVMDTGGLADIPHLDGGRRAAEERPTVTIIVKGDPRDYDNGKIFADAVHDCINMKPPTGFFEARTTSRPLYIREDELNRPEWTINVLLKRNRYSAA